MRAEDTPAAPLVLSPKLIIVHGKSESALHSSGPSVSRQETGRDGIEWKLRVEEAPQRDVALGPAPIGVIHRNAITDAKNCSTDGGEPCVQYIIGTYPISCEFA